MEEAQQAVDAAQAGLMVVRPVLIDAYDHEIERPWGAGTPQPERRDFAAVVVPEQQRQAQQPTAAPSAFRTAVEWTRSAAAPSRKRRAAPKSPKSKRSAPAADPDGLTPVQAVKRPKTMVDHTYRDFSRVEPTAEKVAAAGGEEKEARSFASKLHEILTDTESYGEYIAWRPHGRAFALLKPKSMETTVLGKFFGHGRYSTFLRQLNEFSFKQFTQGDDRNCFYHEAFLRGLPHLVQYMPPPKNNRRRQAFDPVNEPDLFRISELFPLPDQTSAGGNNPPPPPLDGRKQPASSSAHAAAPTNAAPSESDAAERKSADLCMARATAAASLAAADTRRHRRAAQQQSQLRLAEARANAEAATATAENLRRESEATERALFIVSARRRQHQLNLARAMLLHGTASGVGIGLGSPLAVGLPTAAVASAAIAAALNPPPPAIAVAAAPFSAAEADRALVSAMAANADTTHGILGSAAAHHGLGLAAGLSSIDIESAQMAALQLQYEQQQQQLSLYRGFP